MPLPEPPENVRAIFPDGTEVPLEMAYLGREPCGCHLWDATIPIRVHERGSFRIHCDALPDNTALGVHLELPIGLVPVVTEIDDPPPWLRAPRWNN